MKNSFGQFSEGTLARFSEEYSFKTCKRQDGSTYGISDKSNCAQKGSKETTKEKEKGSTKAEALDDLVKTLRIDPQTFENFKKAKAKPEKQRNELEKELVDEMQAKVNFVAKANNAKSANDIIKMHIQFLKTKASGESTGAKREKEKQIKALEKQLK